MKSQLQRRYPSITAVQVWSNVHPMELRPGPQHPLPETGAPIAIGHMANLTIEKGLDVVIDTLRVGLDRGLDLQLHLAGEPVDPRSRAVIEGAVAEFGERIRLWGFISGDEKARFMESIDAFVFPSRYRNEAEPVVVLEALFHGVPCFATDVGCLGSTPGVHAIAHASAFATEVVDCLQGISPFVPLRSELGEQNGGPTICFVAKLFGVALPTSGSR
jgi:glycosyltransferase involved in cell wall biosynthesis